MKIALLSTLLLALVVTPLTSAYDDKVHTFISLLNTAQETPFCNATGGSGNAIATYDTSTMKFCYALSYSGLSQSVEAASHIHAPATINSTGPVLFTLPTGTNKAGCVMVSWLDEFSLFDGLWYFNVHSGRCPGGELRGQILKV